MVAGILEILLGFWAAQQYLPVQGALLLIWVGLFAVFRGISEIVTAFELRRGPAPLALAPAASTRAPGPA